MEPGTLPHPSGASLPPSLKRAQPQPWWSSKTPIPPRASGDERPADQGAHPNCIHVRARASAWAWEEEGAAELLGLPVTVIVLSRWLLWGRQRWDGV